ncbi:hypothetical protein TIFTF001_025400 [Ficus carica]|uniref:Uncharacterized protein n=1 Tax=Ficus carica TaxID=3494 RepID=A0AA88DGL4_FICCA|nr:hypothetical protein TIFTF001_025400 [Ficus carica]
MLTQAVSVYAAYVAYSPGITALAKLVSAASEAPERS